MTPADPRPTRASAAGADRDVLDRLAAAKLWLVSTQAPTTCGNLPYLATALYALVPVPSTRVARMTVDPYWRLYLNPRWVLATDIPVLAAQMAHLAWHLLTDHAARADDVEVTPSTSRYWRRAADATVAELLNGPELDTGLTAPARLGLPPGRSAEEYFAALSRLTVPPTPGTAGDRMREDATGQGEVPAEDASCGSGCDGVPRPYDAPPADPIGGVGESEADVIRRRVAIEFRDHQTQIGSQPGEWSRWVAQVLEPVVPWTQVLAAAVRRGVGWVNGHTDYTYTRVSRRQAASGRIILPATRRPIPEIAIVVDTSGSVDDGLLAQALGEVDGVIKGLGVAGRSVTVLATDAAVHAVTRVRSGKETHLAGGGGTNMGAGISGALELKPHPTLIVILTDGYTLWPADPPPTPVIVVIIGRHTGELPPTPDWVQRVEARPT